MLNDEDRRVRVRTGLYGNRFKAKKLKTKQNNLAAFPRVLEAV